MQPNDRIRILLVIYVFMLRNIVCACIISVFCLIRTGDGRSVRRRRRRTWSVISKIPYQFKHLQDLVHLNDQACVNNLRIDRNAFFRLCYILESVGGLKNDRFVSVPEKVSSFLLILAHHTKNRIVKHNFNRSGQTVSKYFSQTLYAIIKISGLLLVQPAAVDETCTSETWRHFKVCLGALDGTHIEVRVRRFDQPRYRSRKGMTSVNVLGVCNRDMNFVYVLSGWEGSAADSQVLCDALSRPHGLRVPTGCYYLCDAGYTNCEGFLSSYRGTRYHLENGQNGPSAPRNAKECFNMKHAKARNVIERAFGILKARWGILRSPSFYPMKIQNHIILACVLLHNFIRSSMSNDPFEDLVPTSHDYREENDVDVIVSVESSNAWNTWRDNLANDMYRTWRSA